MTGIVLLMYAITRAYHGGLAFYSGIVSIAVEGSDATCTGFRFAHNHPFLGNLVGRCKACKKGVAYVDAVRTSATIKRPGERQGSHWDAAISNGKVLVQRGVGYCGVCPCGSRVTVKPVVGKVSPVHVCNAKCMSSNGPACECSCGGRNHGRSCAS